MKSFSYLLASLLLIGVTQISCEEEAMVQTRVTKVTRGETSGRSYPVGITDLHQASSGGETETALKLIKEGAEVNARTASGLTPLHEVGTGKGNVEIAKALIQAGADVNAINAHGATPLHRAADHEKLEIVKVLLKAGAYVCAKDNPKSSTPLSYAKGTLTFRQSSSTDAQTKTLKQIIRILEEAMRKQDCL